MKCRACGSDKSKVVDSRAQEDGGRWRRRECLVCEQRFSTIEIYVEEAEGRRKAALTARLANFGKRIQKAEAMLHGLRVEHGKLKSQHDDLFPDEVVDDLAPTIGRPPRKK